MIRAFLISSVGYRYVFLLTSDYVPAVFSWLLCKALVFIPCLYIHNIRLREKNNISLQGTTNDSEVKMLTVPEYYPDDSTELQSDFPKPLQQICIAAQLRALAKEPLIDAKAL